MRVGVFPFGCKVNQYDLAEIVAFLRDNGVKVEYQKPGDINVIAGCVVTANAEREGVRLAKRLKRQGRRVLLMGCLAVHRGESLKREGIVEEYFDTTPAGISDLKRYLADELGFLPSDGESAFVVELPEHSRAFLKVQDGCTYSCSFCLSRHTRLSLWSMDTADAVDYAMALVRMGYVEIVITGINLILYESGGNRIRDLVLKIADTVVKMGARVRISSIYPSSELWRMKDIWMHPAVAHHIHLSVQSASPRVLAAMNRANYVPILEEYLLFLREIDPLFGFSGDFIVAYPTEMEEDFFKTVEFVRRHLFHKLHVFPFSPRPGTPAYHLKPLPKGIAKERGKILRKLGIELQAAFFAKMDGNVRQAMYLSDGRVLFDNYVYMKWGAEPFRGLRLIEFDRGSAITMR